MKLLTRNTDYAIRAVCYLARRREGIISVSELVKSLKVPRPFLRKILQILSKKGLIRSCRGIGGGFALAVSPEKIFITDIIEIFQGPLKINECILKKNLCPNVKVCPLKKKIDDIAKYVESELRSITILSLIKG
ncbi:MAG: Rrf2 family transcriptional regulator [Candidatus Omnitrophica bacterium]|nr:Rrf2 family transcriptional regulator [Candidatus Omnitrophota bacterium]MCM8790924.1 Rrf2 family transcriptional regulator [Candidatus Omnitrophota bacterium]